MPERTPRILLVIGVAGAGKSTIGEAVAERLNWAYRDADSFHPQANIDKMSAGQPLNDEDRWPWLDAISGWIGERLQRGENGVVSCSGLKRVYRDRVIQGRDSVRLVFLRGEKSVIAERMAARLDHFMPTALLDSQFAALEEPDAEERPIIADIALSPERICDQILADLDLPKGSI